MTALPVNCISLDAAVERLGPLLFGLEWVASLTPRERWVLEQDIQPVRVDDFLVRIKTVSGSLNFYSASLGSLAEQIAAVRGRVDFAKWQRRHCRAWLRHQKLVVKVQDGAMVVDVRALETALAKHSGLAGPAAQSPRVPRGRKPSLKSIREEMAKAVLEILESGIIPPGRGRLRRVATELQCRLDLGHSIDAIERNIRFQVRAWEAKHPGQ